MSHVTKIDGVTITDIAALASACERIGMELKQDVKEFQAYSRSRCDHKISIKGDNNAFEIGVSKNADGTFGLNWDTYGSQGRKLVDRIGQKGEILKRTYAAEVVKSIARRKGFQATEQTLENGAIRLKIKRGAGSW